MKSRISLTALITLSLLIPAIRTPAQSSYQLEWSTTASGIAGQLGQQYTFQCPSGGRISNSLWGADIYTSDSSICSAAVHSGLINARDGGNVTIKILQGRDFYNGGTQNGVSSRAYGSYRSSFTFIKQDGSPIVVGPIYKIISWSSTASNLSGRLDQDFTYICPAQGQISNSLWGTGLYTSDSSICSAAVHAGQINARDGGQITIRILPGRSFYNGTTRNGVSSRQYGSYGSSFGFPLNSSSLPSSQYYDQPSSNLPVNSQPNTSTSSRKSSSFGETLREINNLTNIFRNLF